ncbi:MAG: helix-turn-helix domain-containing protein [Planctomycetota bacterium]
MAGMFYSLQEAAEKLQKTEDELKQIVKDGRLREFRDGPNLLFKVEEIEALMSDTSIMGPEEAPELEMPAPEAPAPEAPELEILESEVPEPEAAISEVEEPEAPEPEMVVPELLEPEVPEPEMPALEVSEPEASGPEMPALEVSEPEAPEPEMPALEKPEPEAPAPEMPALEVPEPEAPVPEIPAPEVPKPEATAPSEETDLDEIFLAPETGAPVIPSELTDADTALTGLGTSVLGETDQDYDVTDDTMAETSLPTGTTGTTPEVPLEEIEGDVNLDSFGSGSGLLDLSLQADDTSLGGILDEIYTAEGEDKEPVEAEADSAAAVAAEAEQMISEEELIAPQPAMGVSALAQPYIEAVPDTQSNTLGMLMFLPLVVVVYTAVVAVAGLKGVMPSILEAIQGFIWYIMAGAAVVAGLVVGVAFFLAGERSAAPKKAKRPKKPKAPKAPKPPKQPKKPKKPKKTKKPK